VARLPAGVASRAWRFCAGDALRKEKVEQALGRIGRVGTTPWRCGHSPKAIKMRSRPPLSHPDCRALGHLRACRFVPGAWAATCAHASSGYSITSSVRGSGVKIPGAHPAEARMRQLSHRDGSCTPARESLCAPSVSLSVQCRFLPSNRRDWVWRGDAAEHLAYSCVVIACWRRRL